MRFLTLRRSALLTAAVAGLLGVVASARADGGGSVAPANARPEGYSLADMAKITAVYNTGIFAGSADTPDAPDVPFEVVEGDATVDAGTPLYLPIFFADNSAPADPAFPASVNNQRTDAAYLDNFIFNNFGVTAFVVEVDGKITVLNDNYITGVNTPALLDGAGNHYISIAAFISPLAPGVHTVGFGGIIAGSPVIFGSSQITVEADGSRCDGDDDDHGHGGSDDDHGRGGFDGGRDHGRGGR